MGRISAIRLSAERGSHTVSHGFGALHRIHFMLHVRADHLSGEGLPCRADPLARADHSLTDGISEVVTEFLAKLVPYPRIHILRCSYAPSSLVRKPTSNS